MRISTIIIISNKANQVFITGNSLGISFLILYFNNSLSLQDKQLHQIII